MSNNKKISFSREPSTDSYDIKHSADMLSRLLFGDPRKDSKSPFAEKKKVHLASSFSSDRFSNADFMSSVQFKDGEDALPERQLGQSINLLEQGTSMKSQVLKSREFWRSNSRAR